MIPFTKLYNKEPEYDFLKTFGCEATITKPQHQRQTFLPSGEIGIFVGYPDDHRAYYIYIPSKKDVIVSRNVKFNEDIVF